MGTRVDGKVLRATYKQPGASAHGIIDFDPLERQGAKKGFQVGVQASKRLQGREPARKAQNELQGSNMTSKMRSEGLQKVLVFVNLTDLQHLKNAGIPSLFLTTWRLRSARQPGNSKIGRCALFVDR